MRKRKFVITINMLDAGEAAFRRYYVLGGRDTHSVCREIFMAMLDASACVLPVSRQPVIKNYASRRTTGHAKVAAIWASMPKLQGRPLPPTIFHPDNFPDARECRGCYWYLAPRYDRDLRKILANPKQRAKLKFWPVGVAA